MSPLLSRAERVTLALLAVAYGVSRIWRLTALPMFFDEAGHLLWAQRSSFDRALFDGKLLQVMASSVTLRLVPDPLWAGRLATALVGFVTFVSAFALGRRLGGRAGGLLAAALYVASPFALFYDRLALADGFVSALTALALVATIDLARDPRPVRALALGLALAGAGAAKMLGLLALALPPAGILLLAPRERRAWWWAAASLGLAALLLAVPVWTFLTGTGQIHEKAALVAGDRAQLVAENTATAVGWLWTWWTPPLAMLGLAATAIAVARRRGPESLLAFGWLLPLAAFVPLARIWYPRYLLPATVPFLALAASALVHLAARGRIGRIGALLAAALAFAPALAFDLRLLRDPATAPLPAIERWQYVEGWPSGYGWRESYEFLRRERLRHPEGIRVATEARHPVLKAYFIGQAGVDVKAFDFEEPTVLARVAAWVGDRPGWLVTSGAPPAAEDGAGLTLEHVAAFSKPGRGGWLNVYRLVRAPVRGALQQVQDRDLGRERHLREADPEAGRQLGGPRPFAGVDPAHGAHDGERAPAGQVQREGHDLALQRRSIRGREEPEQAEVGHAHRLVVEGAGHPVHRNAVARPHPRFGKWASTQARRSASTSSSDGPEIKCWGSLSPSRARDMT